MQRRGFLSLLLASPVVAKLASATSVAEATPRIESFNRGRVQVMPLPFRPTMVGSGRVEIIEVMPQRIFRPERLLVAGWPAGFELLGLSVAGEPQLDEGLPAEIFAPTSFGSRLEFDVVTPGQSIVMVVANHGAEREFRSMLLGRCI